MNNAIVVGGQWGDEGKGKIVDALSQEAQWVVRFGGGANAGHTLVVAGKKIVLHLVPSGILHKTTRNIIGPGCVVDPFALAEELAALRDVAITPSPNQLLLAHRAHLVTPYHRLIDSATGGKVGTTGRGIGPCYADKAKRIGIRPCDVGTPAWVEQLGLQREACTAVLQGKTQVPEVSDVSKEMTACLETLRGYVQDPLPHLIDAYQRDERVVFEGAQGVLLDLDQGTYPFVTSSNTSVAAAGTSLGLYTEFAKRIAVIKAYTTRVGNGPFPTEMDEPSAAKLREKGNEFGATTGRPRRCGYLDIPALRNSFRANGFTHFALTKLDVLAGLGPVRVVVGAESGKPIFKEFDSFTIDLSTCKTWEDVPETCRAFVIFLEEALGAKLLALSTGPSREDTIWREPLWGGR